jgi:hypothetical protein
MSDIKASRLLTPPDTRLSPQLPAEARHHPLLAHPAFCASIPHRPHHIPARCMTASIATTMSTEVAQK